MINAVKSCGTIEATISVDGVFAQNVIAMIW